MVNIQTLKEIIVSNEDFINKEIGKPVPREGLAFPESSNKVIVFYGVRRSGKTFILYDLFRRYEGRALYIDFEDDRLSQFETKDFERLKQAFFELRPQLVQKGDVVFLLDEVQNVDGWEKFCRRAVEREGFKVFVSGSSSKVMPGEIQTELRGRSWNLEILPFSFAEYVRLKGLDPSSEEILYGKEGVMVKNLFSQYAKWGGFPEVCFADSEFEKRKILREYLEAMFFKDMVERYRITNISLLDVLFDKVFASFATKMSLNSFYRQYHNKLPFSKDILFEYYRHLQQSMLISEVRMFAESSYRRMRNPAKLYPVDIGMCRRITSADFGRILETIVFLELKRRGNENFYFSGQNECDFISKTPENIYIPCQVCHDLHEDNREREIRGLTEACMHLNVSEGFMLTSNEDDEIHVNDIQITVIPVWRWLLLPQRDAGVIDKQKKTRRPNNG
ncbi:MAG: ATP-binding protein [Candidatus Brocadia sp.]|nr:ATP-binding protein [Candidatus Brocadia sp.]UJS18026.1 MAG: ATP-binding protein [Candidatus Jettenia sp.]